MQRESLGFLKVIPIWVALMSGLFSIVREIANLYPPTQTALWDKKVFWACVWVTFVVSSITSWFLKQRELVAEKAKNIEPKLTGRIDCLDHDVDWDLENYGLDDAMPMKIKVVLTLNITLWNESSAVTTVSGFSLSVLWRDGQYQADKLPVEGYTVQKTFPRSEPLEFGYEVNRERLVAFPSNVEITNKSHTSGWLRFLARHLPPETNDNAVLRRDVTWKIYAHDHKGGKHKIYEGTWDLPPCGSVERREMKMY